MNLFHKMSDAFAWKLLIAWIVILATLYSALSVVRHNHFQSGGFDLGLYDQAVWQYSTIALPYNTIKDRFILGDHLTLTLPLLAPLFWLWNDVRALLVFQAVWVSASTIAVFLITRLRKFPPYTAIAVAFVYSLFYGIQYGIFFDFHPVLIATGLIPWMLYFLESHKRTLFYVSLALLLLSQENMGLALASLGFIYIWKKEFRRISVLCIIGGIIYSLLAARIIALFSPVGFQYTPLIQTNPVLFILDMVNSPEKQQVWLYTLSAYTFLPLLSPGAIIAILFDLAQYFTTGPEFARMWSPFMHHRAILAPYIFLGALDGLAVLKRWKINTTLVTSILVISMLIQQYVFHYPLNKLTKSEFRDGAPWIADNAKMISNIAGGVPIATQQSLVPHLSHRKEIYLVWPRLLDFDEKPCGQTSCWWLEFAGNPEYLLIDTHPGVWLTMLLETPQHVNEALSNMEKLGKITLVNQISDIRLYKVH